MVVMFCDASYNNGHCGCGVVIKQLIHGGVKEVRINVKDYAVDNNDAELKSILHGLRHVDKPQSSWIHIVTDSAVAIEILNKCIYRADGDLSGVKEKYRNTVASIIHEIAGEKIRLHHVKGHTKKKDRYHETQNLCDRLAKLSRER
jgi:ribonuclease HI